MRPRLHFTPPANWLNDPNGLVHYAGEYHLFYQHHPHSLDWGPMHWGHAVSRDLIHWQHLPVALAPDDAGMIFSGSAVVDWHNTAGFGAQALVAIYTCHKEPGHVETQALAYSLDAGRTWQKYPGNPVLTNPGLRDFRDPKVFWHEDHWVMCLAAGREIRFYTAPNLRDWTPSGTFAPQGLLPEGAVWETPDLFQLPVAGSGATRWVLTLGVNAGAPAGGSGACYFVGRFDGRTFTAEEMRNGASTPPSALLHWMDYGPDFYAPQTWSDAPNARRICLGWMSNWRYAALTPAAAWRGMFSLPRELTLIETDEGFRLVQQPIAEIRARQRVVFAVEEQTLRPGENPLSGIQASVWDVEAEIAPGAGARFGFRIHTTGGDETLLRFDPARRTITLDRSRSGAVDFHPDFAAPITAPLPPGERLALRLVVDVHSIELFAANGQVTLSAAIFPAADDKRLDIFTDGALLLHKLQVFDTGQP